MPDQPDKPPAFAWTRTQRGVLIALVLTLSSFLLIRLAVNRMYVSNPPPARGERYEELADRIDPNVATWRELAVLPQIGEKRAKEIVAYREIFAAGQRDRVVVFSRPEDMMRVKGIGPALVETLRPHLMFPVTDSTTTRAYNPG